MCIHFIILGSCDENLIQEDGNNEEKSVFSIIDKINKEGNVNQYVLISLCEF